MEAIDEAQYAAEPARPFDVLDCVRFLLTKTTKLLTFGFICAVVALMLYQIFPPKYQATAKLYIMENDGDGVQMSALQAGSLLISDYREVLKTWEVHNAVSNKLGLDMTYREMQDMLKVQIPSGSRLLYITISHADPAMAADLANAYAEAAHAFIVEELHGMQPDMFSTAIIPSQVSGLRLALCLLLAFVVGVIMAAAAYVVFYCLDDRIRTADDLGAVTDAPVLASIPFRKESQMTAQEKETVCLLASQLLTKKMECILVTSPCAGTGVSFVCEDLLQAMTALHRKAIWVRVEHKSFWNYSEGKTLGNYLEKHCNWEELVQPHAGGALFCICGTEDELPSQLFHPRMEVLMKQLRSTYDVLLIDVPPICQRADAAAFRPYVDGVLLVTACGRTRMKEASDCIVQLSQEWPLLGTVLNGITIPGKTFPSFSHKRKASVDA